MVDGRRRRWRRAKHFSLNETPLLQGYIPHAQRPQIFTTLAVRTTGDPLALANAVRDAIWRVDKDQPVWGVQSMEQLLDAVVASPRSDRGLTMGFALVALLLGAVGHLRRVELHDVAAHARSRDSHRARRRGATGRAMVSAKGMRIVAIAVGVGLVASFGGDAAAAQPAVRRRSERRAHVRDRDGGAARRGDARVLSAGAAREPRRSDGRAADRVTERR